MTHIVKIVPLNIVAYMPTSIDLTSLKILKKTLKYKHIRYRNVSVTVKRPLVLTTTTKTTLS